MSGLAAMICALWRSLLFLVAYGRPLAAFAASAPILNDGEAQRPLVQDNRNTRQSSIPLPLFASLERLSRIVDIAYCVGNTGITKPFNCVSRCSDFPSLKLVSSWNTGPLLSDSCGYIAVDHGEEEGGAELRALRHRRADIAFGPSIIVAFRGTYSVTNTIVDLSTVPQKYVPYPLPDDDPSKPSRECSNCTVHLGFLLSWKNARTIVLPRLVALREQYPDYPINLVGHSLGGAVAALAALELKLSLGWDDVMVTTFGEPRVGNEGLSRFIDDVFDLARRGDDGNDDDNNDDGNNSNDRPEEWSYRRVTHKDDPVPLLPLGDWGYFPHAGEIYISKPNLSPSLSDLRSCRGDRDQECIAGADGSVADIIRLLAAEQSGGEYASAIDGTRLPGGLKLWQLFFAHRDYFWRLGLCVPGGDPANWGREANDDVGFLWTG